MKMVSNTEVTAFNECELKHHYMYEREIAPVKVEVAPYRGTIGHAMLAAYYEQIRLDASREDAIEAAWEVYRAELKIVMVSSDFIKLSVLNELRTIMEGYFNHYMSEPFKVISVETVYSAPIQGDIHYGAILDLLVEWTVGPDRGNLVLLDHKFVYNFMNPEVLEVDAQQPKYIKVLQLNGYPIRKGYYNQIRTRSLKNPLPKDLYRREPVKFRNQAPIDQVWEEQKKSVRRIIIPDDEYPIRALAPMICKMCPYRRLCKAEMNGSPTETMLKIEFKSRERPLKTYDDSDGE